MYLKYKYDYEEEYIYTAQPCSLTWSGNTDIMWFDDWWEGQQDVKYISVMIIEDNENIERLRRVVQE